MYHTICLCLIATPFFTLTDCEAGGMFRRVPEVGEWASYAMSGQMTIYIEGKEVVQPGSPAMLTIKCVGEETIDDVRHLWIEAVSSCPELQGPDAPHVVKILVPEDEVMSGVATCNFARGWFGNGQEVAAFERQEPRLDIAWMTALGMLPYVESPVAADDGKTINVEGKEIELTDCESGVIFEFDDRASHSRFAGDCTIWTHDELAFGVGSCQTKWKATYNGELMNEMEATLDLVATGTDAVSELPDNN